MRNLLVAAITIVLVSVTSCNANAKAFYIDKGEKAPFAGLLLDEFSYKQATTESKELVEYKKLHEIDTKIIENLKQQQEDTEIIKMLYFIGGVVVGGLVYKVTDGK